jgi:tetratricopeptide (TPR) repeat protein
MSLPTQSEESKNGASPQSDKRVTQLRPRGIRPLTWILLLAIIGPCAVQLVPQEIGRWHLARAIQQRENGQKETAYQELAAAMQRFPNSPELLLWRAEWTLDDGDKEKALADVNRAVELAADNAKVLKRRAELLLQAGEFAQAVDDLKKVEEFSRRSGKPPLYEALNELAYAQALAKLDLDSALQRVNEALEIMPSEAQTPGSHEYYHRGLILDTRGLIYYLKHEYALALDDMNEAVRRIDERLRKSKHSKTDPSNSSTQKALARGAAVQYYHRSLVLSALERKDDAEKDVEMVRKLIGREPDETLF